MAVASGRALILNVDDYEAARYARSEMLRRAGFDVIDAGSGAQALETAARRRPDLILLDVNLPDMDGFEVCRRLRAAPAALTVPIVHISATFVSDRAQELAYEGGADSYLTDPVEPAVLLATIHSLLRLRRAEEGLRAASRGWQATFDAIGEGICLLGADGRVARCNGAFATLLDAAPDDLIGRPWAGVWKALGGTGPSPTEQVEQSRRRETLDLQHGRGWFRLLVDPVLEDTALVGLVCIVSDVTLERQTAEVRAALLAREQQAREEAEANNRAKDEFLAMLGHELRNPLDVIGSAVRVLAMQPAGEGTTVKAREVIARQVAQLSRLVDDLLDVGRVTTGKIALVPVPVDLAETAERCVAGLMPPGQAADHTITLRTQPTWVRADQARLEQIVMNLLANALKYTPRGGDIEVTVAGSGEVGRLSVKDTGVGMTPQMIQHIFDLFYQGDRTLDRAGGGLGIGLTLVRRLVELHGGRVEAESPGPGRGSTVTVELPRIAAPATGERVAPRPVVSSRRRIVIVEDGRDSRDMLRYLLEHAGHEVHEAADGPSGLRMIVERLPDIALVDVGLPDLDGYEVARRVRAHEAARAVRLVALTGYGLPDDLRRSQQAGFDAHLVKPVDPARLAALIREGPPA